MSTIDRLLGPVPIPRLIKVRQLFERPWLADVGVELLSRREAEAVLGRIQNGSRIALAVGSRGVSNQPLLVRLVV